MDRRSFVLSFASGVRLLREKNASSIPQAVAKLTKSGRQTRPTHKVIMASQVAYGGNNSSGAVPRQRNVSATINSRRKGGVVKKAIMKKQQLRPPTQTLSSTKQFLCGAIRGRSSGASAGRRKSTSGHLIRAGNRCGQVVPTICSCNPCKTELRFAP